MNKLLVKSEEEFASFVNSLIDNHYFIAEDVANFFNISFENSDGQIFEEYCASFGDEEYFEYSNKFRVTEFSNVPEQYPCLILYLFEKTFDRSGRVSYNICEYVYLSDFESVD